MPSIAATSAVPITANCTSCSGEQLTLAPRSSTVTTPSRVGSCPAIAGRSMPGSVFSTKREIAISAPVLPAETHACATSSLTRLIATRIDESFFLRNASAGGSCISTTSLAACSVSRSRAGDESFASAALQRRLQADRDHPRVGRCLEKLERRRQRGRGAVVAPHRVDGYRDRHGGRRDAYSSALVVTTFLPR